MTNTLKKVLPAALSAAILFWLLRGIDLDALADVLSWSVAGQMTLSLLVYGAATLWLEATSLGRLLNDGQTRLSLWTLARIKCASYLVAILNYALGAAALALLLQRRAQLPLGRAAGVVILVSSVDLIVVLSMAATGTVLMQAGPRVHASVLLVGLVGFFGGLVLLRMPGSLGPLDRLRQLSIFEGLRTVAPLRLAELFGLRIAFAICFVSISAAAFHAFDVHVPLLEMVAGVLIVAVVGAVPIAVSGLGTTQAAFIYLFSEHASQERLLAMSLVLSAGLLLLRAGMGVVFAREYTREALEGTRGAPT